MALTRTLAAALLTCAVALPVAAHESVYFADLSGPNEAPPNASPGTGWARVTIDFDLVTMHVEASFSGLLGTTTASHIHCCTAAPDSGTLRAATPMARWAWTISSSLRAPLRRLRSPLTANRQSVRRRTQQPR